VIPTPNQNNFSEKFNNPTRTVTNDEVIQKVKIEAKAARAKVPPDMRAKPYSFNDSNAPKQKTGFSNQFKSAGQAAQEDNKSKMSSAFNGASKAHKGSQGPEWPEPRVRI
jgi:hypothetical protein